MILHCTFEELSALSKGAERILGGPLGGGVAAPPETAAELEAFASRLDGDLSIDSLEEQQGIARVIDLILSVQRRVVDELILETYVGGEDAVNAYFEYAHSLTVQRKVREIGDEMQAIAEVMHGSQLTSTGWRED